MAAGDLLWTPPEDRAGASVLADFLRWLGEREGRPFPDHDALWSWSAGDVAAFWPALWEYFGVAASAPYETVLDTHRMPGARWFSGARLSWAEHMLRHDGGSSPALICVAEDGEPVETSWDDLRRQVSSLAAALREMGVRPGDRVAAYLPNTAHAVVGVLASAAVGAVWACCAPDFGTEAAIGRLAQVEPVVLILADGYHWNGRVIDRRDVAEEIRAAIPSVRHTVRVPYVLPGEPMVGDHLWDGLVAGDAVPSYEQVDFSHPLWVLFSSGTTGLPKGLVHGHGGILLEHLKWLGLYLDLRPGERIFIYTSTGWMMWNALIAGLLTGATIVLYEGSPSYPDVGAMWRVAAATRARVFGCGAGLLTACQKAGLVPGERYDLSALQTMPVTGSPLPIEGWHWVYEAVSQDLRLDSTSGGTDVCTAFAGGSEVLPVYAGEVSTRFAGVALASWDVHGQPVVGEVGELVVTEPMPSMPLYFWNDASGERYADAYFDMWPGVWRHGDWITLTDRGSLTIHGRSDATLNRQGVRMGSGEFYDVVEKLPEVREALVVGVELPDGGYYMPLFVALNDGVEWSDELRLKIANTLRLELSPRHVPDEVIPAPGVPHTLTGKRLEVPIKRLYQGVPIERACNLGTVDAPDVVRWYADRAAAFRSHGM